MRRRVSIGMLLMVFQQSQFSILIEVSLLRIFHCRAKNTDATLTNLSMRSELLLLLRYAHIPIRELLQLI